MAKVQARVDADGTVRTRRRGKSWKRTQPSIDWDRVDATTEADLERQAEQDDDEAAREAAAWARQVRRRTGLPQGEFARRLGIRAETVRRWERGEAVPEGAEYALLRIIDRIPEAALAALAA